MSLDNTSIQPNLFDRATETSAIEPIVMHALGEFQARGKVLAARELPLDRLRGAFRRAAERVQSAELSDDEIAAHLEKMGAKIVRVPSFVAKHPFRVTVQPELAEKALAEYRKSLEND